MTARPHGGPTGASTIQCFLSCYFVSAPEKGALESLVPFRSGLWPAVRP